MSLSQGRHWLLARTLAIVALSCAGIAGVIGSSPPKTAAELVENTDFEAKELQGWSLVAAGGAKGQLERESVTRNGETNSQVARLTVMNPSERCGVSNRGGSGIRVVAGDWYDLAFRARTEKRENNRGYGLTVSLESADGERVFARTTLPEVGGDWKHYTVALHARVSEAKARLVITMFEPGTIWLDEVSLVERPMAGGQPRQQSP